MVAILCHHALKAAQRLFGIPDFRYYAIADGICAILAGRQKPAFDFAPAAQEDSARADGLDLYGSWIT